MEIKTKDDVSKIFESIYSLGEEVYEATHGSGQVSKEYQDFINSAARLKNECISKIDKD